MCSYVYILPILIQTTYQLLCDPVHLPSHIIKMYSIFCITAVKYVTIHDKTNHIALDTDLRYEPK